MGQLQNPSFADPGVVIGTARHWSEAQANSTVVYDSDTATEAGTPGAEDIAVFDAGDGNPPYEAFAGGWEGNHDSVLVLLPAHLLSALFEVRTRVVEDFEYSWVADALVGPPWNHQGNGSVVFSSGMLVAAAFTHTVGSQDVDGFESDWDDNQLAAGAFSGPSVTSALAVFDPAGPEDYEDFEEAWDANDTAVAVSAMTTTAAMFDAAVNGFENFEGTW